MKLKILIILAFLTIYGYGCNEKADNKPVVPPEGSVNISDLATRHDYYLPFSVLNNENNIRRAVLNDSVIAFAYGDFVELKVTGFYELILEYTGANQPNDTILFTTKTAEREASEWGIRAWVPAHFKTTLLGPESVEIFYPRRYTDSIKVPFIFYVRESGSVKPVYCRGSSGAAGVSFNIKRGAGSANISAAIAGNTAFTIGGRQVSTASVRITDTSSVISGTIGTAIDIPANSFVRISGNLNINSAGSLTIHEGALVVIDEAVDINVSGPVIFLGTAANPILVTCSNKNKFWGGFITRVSSGTINAKYTIFCQSGYHDTAGYNWGHSGRQALFYTENSTLRLDHCFILDHIGQIFYPQNSTLTLTNILVQRVQTGGQINTSYLTLRNSIFTDFPEESDIFLDLDNDALYLSASSAVIDSTTFMYAKDDGLDSGNTEGGDIIVTNCRFEACFHEGAALSSGNGAIKHHTFTKCIFTNCGQGLELGFSSPNHHVLADSCQFLKNGIGIRYGDNYTWADVKGWMNIRNSVSLGNDRDVWNMVRMIWSPRLANMTFENTQVSKLCQQYPQLLIKSN